MNPGWGGPAGSRLSIVFGRLRLFFSGEMRKVDVLWELHRSHCWMECLALTSERLLEEDVASFGNWVAEEADKLIAMMEMDGEDCR